MKLLYPFALIYGIITWIRNLLFEVDILKQKSFKIPIISIGNLNIGGSGKTPHIEYFINFYNKIFNIAVISRGYGRKTKGFRYVQLSDFAETCGDEPLQIKHKFDGMVMAVCEKRVDAISKIMADHPEINLILLDDAFQHRFVKPSLSILLTDYSFPFWRDSMLPAGKLREFGFGYKRANALIITKCPDSPSIDIPKHIRSKPIFYSHIEYMTPSVVKGIFSKRIVVISGIANSVPFITHLKKEGYELIYHFDFSDHHTFTKADRLNIGIKIKEELACMVLTTEKDYMRFTPSLINEIPNLAYVPIRIRIDNAPENWLTL